MPSVSLTLPHKRTNSSIASSLSNATSNSQPTRSSQARAPLTSISESSPRLNSWTFPRSAPTKPSILSSSPLASSPLSAGTPSPISTSRFRAVSKDRGALAGEWIYKLVFLGVCIFFFSALAGKGYDGGVALNGDQLGVRGQDASPSKGGGNGGKGSGENISIPDVYLPKHEDADEHPRDAHQVVGDSSHDAGEDWLKNSPKDAVMYDDQHAHVNKRPLFHNREEPVDPEEDDHEHSHEVDAPLEDHAELAEEEQVGIAEGVEHEDAFNASEEPEDGDEGSDEDDDEDEADEEDSEATDAEPLESNEELLPGEGDSSPDYEEEYQARKVQEGGDSKRSREEIAKLAAEERERERARWVADVRQGRAMEGNKRRMREVR